MLHRLIMEPLKHHRLYPTDTGRETTSGAFIAVDRGRNHLFVTSMI